jgi:hypothetical protein
LTETSILRKNKLTNIGDTVKNLIFCLLATYALLITGCGNSTTESEQRISFVMSPCQCKMSGGCGISFFIGNDILYADETSPKDYDRWGVYSGQIEVPSTCRKN